MRRLPLDVRALDVVTPGLSMEAMVIRPTGDRRGHRDASDRGDDDGGKNHRPFSSQQVAMGKDADACGHEEQAEMCVQAAGQRIEPLGQGACRALPPGAQREQREQRAEG